jgi:aspartyl protease family protein
LLRFVVIAVAVIGLALAAPRYAPALLAAMLHVDDQIVPAEPAAGESAIAQPAAPVEEEFVPPPESMPMIQAFEGRRVTVEADGSGHYLVEVRINGRTVPAMIDTGATTVALTAETARRIGIVPMRSAFTQPVATANGVLAAAPVRLREVRVGTIVVRNVDALVVPGEGLTVDLLGMSFLGRLQKFESSGGRLLLVQ